MKFVVIALKASRRCRPIKLGSVLMLLAMLGACSLFDTKPVPSVLTQSIDHTAIARAKERAKAEAAKQWLRVLLAKAQQALAQDQLMSPLSTSAYSYYQQVLALDELNEEAHWGMRKITSRYLQLAEQAHRSGRIDKAELMLQRAEKISASPRQIEALRQRYQQRADKKDNEHYLSARQLSARSDTIKQQLFTLAQQVKEKDLRLLIVARNDSEGRWVYSQMREAVAGYRLRGNIELGRVPRVLLIELHPELVKTEQ